MTKAAKKTNSLEQFEDGKCTKCGHDFDQHMGPGSTTHGPFTCPPTPPAKSKQVTVDEAVVSKGGKPGFVQQLEDATGVTALKDFEAKAAANFNAEPGEPLAEIFQAKLSQLRPSPRNPRSSLGDLKELALSVALPAGILSPLLVRDLGDDTYEIVSGHRRFAAAELAKLEQVPCIVRELTELQALELNLTEQLQRKELSPLEEAKACRDLAELSGYDTKQIATKLSQSEKWVRGRMKLNDLAPEAKKLLASGLLPIGAAVDLALLPQAQQAEAVKELKNEANNEDGELTTGRAITALRDFSKPLKAAPFDTKREYFGVLAPACVKCPKNSACGERGLFDTFKADEPRCTDLPCWDKKALAEFEEKAEALAQEGAKVLPLAEGPKLFNNYRDTAELSYASKYVDGAAKPNDAKKRTWEQLAAAIPEKFRPQVVVAQDGHGKLHKLYDGKEIEKLAAKHAGSKKAPAYDHSGHTADYRKKRKKELIIEKRRDVVADQVLEAAVRKVALAGLTQADWEQLAGDAVDAAYDTFDGTWRALGLLEKTSAQRVAWCSKGASTKDLQAVLFGLLIERHFTRAHDFEPEFLSMAKRFGCDPKAMMKAQADGEVSEVAIAAKKKGKKS